MGKGKTSNDLLMDMVRAAELHCATFIFSDAVAKYGGSKPAEGVNPSVHNIMRRLTVMWGIYTLHRYSDQGFKEGFISPQQVKDIEDLYLDVSAHCFVCHNDENDSIFVLKRPPRAFVNR